MSRDLNQAIINASTLENITPLIFVNLDFATDPVYVNSTVLSIPWNGQSWLGVEGLGDITNIAESSELSAAQVSFTLTGIPRDLITIATDQDYQGRDVTIYFGVLDSNHDLDGSPSTVWKGRIDTMSIELGQFATVTVNAENRLADWQRPRIRRYSHQDQQLLFAGDLGFEFINTMADIELKWGEA